MNATPAPVPRVLSFAALLVVVAMIAASSSPDAWAQDGEGPTTNFDLGAVQGILAIQQLDGWLLYDYQGQNPIARELVAPEGEPSRRWFYLIPDEGEPMLLIHQVDAANFEQVAGRKAVYATYSELEKGLESMLRRRKRIAMEYSPKAALPALSRVDAGTIEMIRSRRVKVQSSADLVQFAKSLWGPEGRMSHYVAAHHLEELRKGALAFVADKISQRKQVTERDVQRYLLRGYRIRGLLGPPPVVAAGKHTADPYYVPKRDSETPIAEGDLLLIEMWAKVKPTRKNPRSIFADITWIAYVGTEVPSKYVAAFAAVAQARDQALELVTSRARRRRAIKGYEVDRLARKVLTDAGHGTLFVHRTGHSIDTDVHGAGANLDDYETRDSRNLVIGSGFSIAPGIYFPDDFGVRAEINVYIAPTGVEVTTPKQDAITAILARD